MRGVAADADRQRQDGDDREARGLAQRAQREPHILRDAFERGEEPHVAGLLLQMGDVAESAPRHLASGRVRHAAGPQVRLAHRQVKRDLVVQVALEPAPTHERNEPVPDRRKHLAFLIPNP
jgi:hypothetical protein